MQMPRPRDLVIYWPGPRAFSVMQKPWGWAHISVKKPQGARREGVVTGQTDTCITSLRSNWWKWLTAVFLTIMLTKALQTFESFCLKTACTFHFQVYALIPLENQQSAVSQETRENDSLNNVLISCVLPLFRFSDLSVPEWRARFSFNPILPEGGGGADSAPSCFSSTILKRLKLWSWHFLTLKIHVQDTFYKLFQVVTFWGVTMATKLQKEPCKIWLNRKVKFLNNSVIFKDIELKFGI